MSAAKRTDGARDQNCATGSSEGATAPAGAAPGFWGMLTRAVFSPPERTPGPPPATSAKEPRETNLPKNLSHVSFASETFTDGNYFDIGDSDYSDSDAPDSPRTPPPPSMRRNGSSFGSFNSVAL